MKQNTTVFLGIVLASLMLFTLCSANDQCCNLNTVRVSGNGKIQVEADIAIIYAYINQDGATVAQALQKVNAILASILTTLQNNDVSKDEITTSYISIYPKYDYSTGTGVIVGYTVYVSLTITIKGIYNDNSKVAAVIDGIASAGVSSISGITYDSSDPSYGKDNARKAAFADATNKAKQYAKLAGRKLGKIVIIDETNQYYYPYYTKVGSDIGPNGQLAAPLLGQDSDTTLPVGKITVIVNVIITWIII